MPAFLKHIAHDVYVCGKTINLLKLCCPQVRTGPRLQLLGAEVWLEQGFGGLREVRGPHSGPPCHSGRKSEVPQGQRAPCPSGQGGVRGAGCALEWGLCQHHMAKAWVDRWAAFARCWLMSKQGVMLDAWAWGLQAAAAVGGVRTRGPVGQPSAGPDRVRLSCGQRVPSSAGPEPPGQVQGLQVKVSWRLAAHAPGGGAPRVAWSRRPVCPIWLMSVSGAPPARWAVQISRSSQLLLKPLVGSDLVAAAGSLGLGTDPRQPVWCPQSRGGRHAPWLRSEWSAWVTGSVDMVWTGPTCHWLRRHPPLPPGSTTSAGPTSLCPGSR